MNRPPTRVAVLVLTLCTLTALSLGVVLADDGQSIVVDDTVETETQTVTLSGENYTVSETGRVSAGDPLSVGVTNASTASVHLYYTNGTLVTEHPVGVDDPATFETANRSPGEYLLATHDAEGNFDAAKPLVVTGYDTSLSATTAAADDSENGTETTFSVTASERTDAPPVDSVVVVVRGDDGVTRVDASADTEGNYIATADLAPGEYRAYAEVRAGGERVGLSDTTTVTLSNETGQADQTDETNQSGTTTADRSPTASSDDATDGLGGLVAGSLSDGRLAKLVNTPSLLVGAVLGGLVLSTVVYQLVYSLRRR